MRASSADFTSSNAIFPEADPLLSLNISHLVQIYQPCRSFHGYKEFVHRIVEVFVGKLYKLVCLWKVISNREGGPALRCA